MAVRRFLVGVQLQGMQLGNALIAFVGQAQLFGQHGNSMQFEQAKIVNPSFAKCRADDLSRCLVDDHLRFSWYAAFFCHCSKLAGFFWALNRTLSHIDHYDIPVVSILVKLFFTRLCVTCQSVSTAFRPSESTDTLPIRLAPN